eukprot:gene10935-17050_t
MRVAFAFVFVFFPPLFDEEGLKYPYWIVVVTLLEAAITPSSSVASSRRRTVSYVNLASVQWIRFENVKEDATVFNFIETAEGKFVTWDMGEHNAGAMVGQITSNPRDEFFTGGPFKVFVPVRINSGELRGEFFIQRTLDDPPTILAIFNTVRTTIITAISFVIVSQGHDDGDGGGTKRSAEQYLSQVIVHNMLMRITGGARHVYVHWEKKRMTEEALTRRSLKRIPLSPIPIK